MKLNGLGHAQTELERLRHGGVVLFKQTKFNRYRPNIGLSGNTLVFPNSAGMDELVLTKTSSRHEDRQAVLKWRRVPPLRVHAVEELTGIPRGELRPDLYPAERERRGRSAAQTPAQDEVKKHVSLTNAQRQARYRERVKARKQAELELNAAVLSLARAAVCQGGNRRTRRQILATAQ
jgi:DNA-binding transcriptional regulator YdaS (Cro superfamily)